MDWPLICLLGATGTLVWAWYKLGYRRIRLPPGPKSYPILGCSMDVTPGAIHRDLGRWAAQYGDMFTLNLLGDTIVVLSNRELIKDALILRSEDFGGRPITFRLKYISRGGKGLIFRTYNETFKAIKKNSIKSLRVYGDGLSRLEEISKRVIGGFRDHLDTLDGKPFNLDHDMFMAVANVITSMVFGKEFSWDDPEMWQLKKDRDAVTRASIDPRGNIYDALPWLRHIYHTQLFQTLEQGSERMDEFFFKHLNPLTDNINLESLGCFAEAMFAHHNQLKTRDGEQIIDYDNYFVTIKNVLNAGYATTSSAMTSFLLILQHHPEVEKRLVQEIEEVIGYDRFPTLADRGKMPYMEAAVMELLRFLSHVPFAVPHMTTRDVEIGGYQLPKGTQVWCNLWALHHDTRYWEKPWDYIPERFLDEHGEVLPADHEKRQSLLPFGAGRRICLGEHLARNRVFLFTCALLQRYRFTAPEGEKLPDCDPRGFNMNVFLEPPSFNICALKREH